MLPYTHEVYKRSHVISRGEKNKKIMLTNHGRRNINRSSKIQSVEKLRLSMVRIFPRVAEHTKNAMELEAKI